MIVGNLVNMRKMYIPYDGGGMLPLLVEGGPIFAVDGVGVPPAIEKNCTFVLGGIGAPTIQTIKIICTTIINLDDLN